LGKKGDKRWERENERRGLDRPPWGGSKPKFRAEGRGALEKVKRGGITFLLGGKRRKGGPGAGRASSVHTAVADHYSGRRRGGGKEESQKRRGHFISQAPEPEGGEERG